MDKSPDAFRTISEVAEWLGVQTHVLRFWESKFTQVKPVKRAGGRRYYRPDDMRLIGGIKALLHDDGMTIKGVQKVLREQGVAYVSSKSQTLDGDLMAGLSDALPDSADTLPPPAADPAPTPATVLPFQARGAPAEPAAPPAPDPEDETPAEPAATPQDVTPAAASAPDTTEPDQTPVAPETTASEASDPDAPAPRPRIVDAPDPPPDHDIAVPDGVLARISRMNAPDAQTAAAMGPLLLRMAELRTRLAGHAQG